MYVSSRQGYKPPVKSTGRGKKYSHFASLKYCNGAETFYTYDPQRGKAGGQMAHTNTYGTDTGKKFQLANVKDVIGDFASYGSDPRRTQYAGSETWNFTKGKRNAGGISGAEPILIPACVSWTKDCMMLLFWPLQAWSVWGTVTASPA